MLKGFRDFIMKGNVVDLAVAVVIGAAFGAVITALVDNVLMPLIAALVGSPNFDSFLLLNINGVDIKFGVFLTALVNFLLIAAAVYFALVMPMQKLNNHLGCSPRRRRRRARGRNRSPAGTARSDPRRIEEPALDAQANRLPRGGPKHLMMLRPAPSSFKAQVCSTAQVATQQRQKKSGKMIR
ncbi:large conductance mechanosensitive channel protein MscL [Glutamicibacter halophytocola]